MASPDIQCMGHENKEGKKQETIICHRVQTKETNLI